MDLAPKLNQWMLENARFLLMKPSLSSVNFCFSFFSFIHNEKSLFSVLIYCTVLYVELLNLFKFLVSSFRFVFFFF